MTKLGDTISIVSPKFSVDEAEHRGHNKPLLI